MKSEIPSLPRRWQYVKTIEVTADRRGKPYPKPRQHFVFTLRPTLIWRSKAQWAKARGLGT